MTNFYNHLYKASYLKDDVAIEAALDDLRAFNFFIALSLNVGIITKLMVLMKNWVKRLVFHLYCCTNNKELVKRI